MLLTLKARRTPDPRNCAATPTFSKNKTALWTNPKSGLNLNQAKTGRSGS